MDDQGGPSEAQLWDNGCRTDPPRNLFVIPEVARILSVERPARVLDVGAGTGYVAREIDKLLAYRPEWTLLDINSERLQLAASLKPQAMVQETLCSDVTRFSGSTSAFDAALATFTLLEISDIAGFAGALWGLLSAGAVLIVALPDAWEDVLAASAARPEVLQEYLGGQTSILKIDKFTSNPYPFRAIRLEVLVQCFLSMGFHLCEILQPAEGSIFLLTFRRCLEAQRA